LTTQQIDAMRATAPLARSGTPQDAAGAIYLFCIPQSDYVSGEILTCAGGL
jgi:3-oxoacyl-[acyl-carrier protein] reductase